ELVVLSSGGCLSVIWDCFMFVCFVFFFFKHSPTPGIYPLSLHDALPICRAAGTRARPSAQAAPRPRAAAPARLRPPGGRGAVPVDRKSTRLNSSHVSISYAVFCLKKKTYSP